jgi:hypothetical protein
MRLAVTSSAITLVAWQMEQGFAGKIVEQQLAKRAEIQNALVNL